MFLCINPVFGTQRDKELLALSYLVCSADNGAYVCHTSVYFPRISAISHVRKSVKSLSVVIKPSTCHVEMKFFVLFVEFTTQLDFELSSKPKQLRQHVSVQHKARKIN